MLALFACNAVQPPVDRAEQVAAILRLEKQTGTLAPAAAKEVGAGSAALGVGWAALQPPVDRNEQLAAIRQLEKQTGIEAPAAAKDLTASGPTSWGSTLSRGDGWNREAFEEDMVGPRGYGNGTKAEARNLRNALSKLGPSNLTRANNELTVRTIWIFWAQGEAHLAAQKQGKYGNCLGVCVQKWRDLNPDWTVELIDDARAKELSPSYSRFINKGSIGQALLSDVLRLDLLNQYGGVWADVSVCPVAPLNDYIEEKLAPAGFYTLWLNHWPTKDDALTCETACYDEHASSCNGRTTVTWFMAAASPKNYIMHVWHKALSDRMALIEKDTNDYPYFMVHCVFTALLVDGKNHLTDKLEKMPKDMPAGDAGWSKFLNLNPYAPDRMVDKFHEGCPLGGTVRREASRQAREVQREARDEAAVEKGGDRSSSNNSSSKGGSGGGGGGGSGIAGPLKSLPRHMARNS